MHETYWELIRDPAHWLLELTIMALFDGVIGALLWPWLRKHYGHHIARDRREGNR